MRKRILSIFVTVLMAFAMMPITASADTQMSGDGTPTKPYEIRSYAQLKEFATIVNDGETSACAILTADIIATDDTWIPIGNLSTPYSGTFDGKGHIITGLDNTGSTDKKHYQGLFGFVGSSEQKGEIENVGVIDCTIRGDQFVGGVAGANTGGSTISNCFNTGDVSGDQPVGGVAGANTGGSTISNCFNTGDVSSEIEAGGVVGRNYKSTITNCFNTGDAQGITSVGGVVGWNYNGEIANCYSDTNFCSAEIAVGSTADTDNVKGLDTYYMTGERANKASTMGSFFGEGSPWLMKSDGMAPESRDYCLYYPRLKGFSEDWAAKTTVGVEWNELDSYTYNGASQKPTAKKVTISNGSKTVSTENYTLNYYQQSGTDSVDPVNAGQYKAVISFTADGNEGIEKAFEIKPAPLTITAKDQNLEYTGEMQGPGDEVYSDPEEIAKVVTVEGLKGSDELTSIQVDGQGQAVGTYELMPGSALINDDPDAKDNYEITYVPGTLTIKDKPAPEPQPEPKPTPAKVSDTLMAKATAKGKTGLTIAWTKVNGASGYDIFFAKCNHGSKKTTCKKVKTVKGNKTFSWTKTGLKNKQQYKAYVKAYAMKGGKKTYIRTSPMIHAYAGNSTKNYTNAKSVSVNKTAVSLKKGKTFKIRAKVSKINTSKKLMPKSHVATLRYRTANSKVAAVDKTGKITAKGKGACYVYAYAHNGVYKKIKVTVK